MYSQCEIDKDEEDETCRPTSRSLCWYHKKKRRELQAFLGKIILLLNIFKVVMLDDKVEGTAVLIIAYDYVVRDILTRMLTTKGYRVVNRSVGCNGIRTFKKGKGKFAIVVIDLELPDMSGLGVAKKIKEINHTTPIILLKRWERGPKEEELRDAGVDLVMSKPLVMDEAYEIIKKAVASIHE